MSFADGMHVETLVVAKVETPFFKRRKEVFQNSFRAHLSDYPKPPRER